MQIKVVILELTISMHFQQFEDLKFQIFLGGACPQAHQNPCRVSNCPDLSRIVMISAENPESTSVGKRVSQF